MIEYYKFYGDNLIHVTYTSGTMMEFIMPRGGDVYDIKRINLFRTGMIMRVVLISNRSFNI